MARLPVESVTVADRQHALWAREQCRQAIQAQRSGVAPAAAAAPAQTASLSACNDSITARVARLPAESVTVEDRDHALWAAEQCREALAAQSRRVASDTTWPPAACRDTFTARIARMPPESVSVADERRALASQQQCQQALSLAAEPQSVASRHPLAVFVLGGALVLLILLVT